MTLLHQALQAKAVRSPQPWGLLFLACFHQLSPYRHNGKNIFLLEKPVIIPQEAKCFNITAVYFFHDYFTMGNLIICGEVNHFYGMLIFK
jgi:hypothetical protein